MRRRAGGHGGVRLVAGGPLDVRGHGFLGVYDGGVLLQSQQFDLNANLPLTFSLPAESGNVVLAFVPNFDDPLHAYRIVGKLDVP